MDIPAAAILLGAIPVVDGLAAAVPQGFIPVVDIPVVDIQAVDIQAVRTRMLVAPAADQAEDTETNIARLRPS